MCGKSNKIILKILFIRKMIFIFPAKSHCSIDKLQAPPIKCPDVVEIG